MNRLKKPFPWHCVNCRATAVYEAAVDYTTQMYHEANAYTVKIDALKTPKCRSCGLVIPDGEALETITRAFMRQINLLLPEEIAAHREKANLTQQALDDALGVSDGMIARLEAGEQVETRTLDNLLRLFFGMAQVREILTTHQIATLPAAVPT